MDTSFIDLFEVQVQQTPDKIAVVFEQHQLTFKELNAQANMLAHFLKANGVKDETLVPLCIERGNFMIIGMLGIMKAGGAYVPIDTDFPAERIKYMLTDTAATIVVSSRESAAKLVGIPGLMLVEIETIKDQPVGNLPTKVSAAQLAYVIYTSGSTGTPKGVMVEHRNLVDYITGLADKTQINECTSFALVSTIATDLGNTVIYPSLAFGGALHIFSKEYVSNIELLHQYFKKHAIECLKIVPSHWRALSNDGELLLPLKLLVFGGEALPEKLIEEIRSSGTHCRIVNHYGPTETTIGKLLYIVEPDQKYEYTVPIGKPFSNTKVLVLTNNLKLCPIGVPGQLYITGEGVARGYLNNPELTNEKFIPNPFSKEGYAVMYSTGDLVKYLPDKNILFIGRVDNQVKIRGYRIELGEIENILQQCASVSEVVVLAHEDKQGNKGLVGYVVPKGYFDKDAILAYAKEKLPDYMIPGILMEQDSMPLTANGKIDRKALPDPDATGALGDEYVAPRNELEAKMAAIWQDILEVDQVGMNDDFFELGGHSLLAVRLVSAIRKAFIVEMPISDIFDFPTVALVTMQLNTQSGETVLTTIDKVATRPAYIPLSFSQERLWLIDQLKGSREYHVPTVLRLKGNLNIAALNDAFKQLVGRHEVLRTTFKDRDGEAYQHVIDTNDWNLSVIDGALHNDNSGELQHTIQQLINATFDLAQDYMIRAHLITLQNQEFVLVIVQHHIASDGWSRSIMVKEVVEGYNAFVDGRSPNLPELPIQYADYAIWQRDYLQGEVLDKELAYWKEKLKEVKPLDLPVDYTRPAVQSNRGAATGFSIDLQLLEKLKEVSQQQGVTLFMTLIAAFKILLHRYSGQQDICVGTPIAGRRQQVLEELMGFFLNTLALRTQVSREASFKEFLHKVRVTTAEAYDHQEAPFEKVMEAVITERDMSRNPLFQVMFELQNTPTITQPQLGEVELLQESFVLNTAKFDLTFSITEHKAGLAISVIYSTDLFDKKTVIQFYDYFKQLLVTIAKNPDQNIQELIKLSDTQLFTQPRFKVEYPSPANSFEYFEDKAVEQTIVSRFEEQVKKLPGNIAICNEDGTEVTYAALNELSNGLARKISDIKELSSGHNIALLLDHGQAAITGMLGVLKSGNTYVPLDPFYPAERLKYILNDTNCDLIITSNSTAELAKELLEEKNSSSIINLDEEVEPSQVNLNLVIPLDGLAYILYTSGSTGEPKGVMQSHRNVLHFMRVYTNNLHISKKDRVSLLPTYAFDSSVMDIYGALFNGASLYPYNIKQNGISELANWLKENVISIAHMVPTVYRNFILTLNEGVFEHIRLVVMGGEPVYKKDFEDFKKHFIEGAIFINGYGPTESTITLQKLLNNTSAIDKWNIPIGLPVQYTEVYLLNEKDEEVEIYGVGEIVYRSEYLALGYWNKQKQTNQVFTVDPKTNTGRVYRSGDLGRRLPGMEIEFLGRKDNQVKIRGQRVELPEIEQHLIKIDGIDKAVVVIRTINDDDRLLAYIVLHRNSGLNENAIRQALGKRLPVYMIPSHIVLMEEFPLTATGKIDRKTLPVPTVSELISNDYVAPQNETEQALANIWQELLGIEKIGIYDNFFELGGNSLLAIRLISTINKTTNLKLSVNDLFIQPTISSLARINNEESEEFEDLFTNYKYLVPIKKGSNKKPTLYIICGGGGTARRFFKFAEMMDEDQRVYSLQPPADAESIKGFPDSVEEIAKIFIKEIIIKNPNGPFALSGHCIGGIIAFEMAKQLEEMGKKVHLLAMFDTIVRFKMVRNKGSFKNLFNIPLLLKHSIAKTALKLDFETFLLKNYTGKAIEYKMMHAKHFVRKLIRKVNQPKELKYNDLDIFRESTYLYKLATSRYKILPYKGNILMFYAKERYYFTDVDNNIKFKRVNLNNAVKNNWNQYANSVSIFDVEGDHSDMFDTIHGNQFASLLQNELNKTVSVN